MRRFCAWRRGWVRRFNVGCRAGARSFDTRLRTGSCLLRGSLLLHLGSLRHFGVALGSLVGALFRLSCALLLGLHVALGCFCAALGRFVVALLKLSATLRGLGIALLQLIVALLHLLIALGGIGIALLQFIVVLLHLGAALSGFVVALL